MRRDLSLFTEREFDVVIVGGGIFGICTAWEAASRGLTVALVERGDFAAAASANCFKMIHSGIRYLQHVDLERLRASNRERNVLLRIAPHQTAPLPVVVPTYGRSARGRLLLGTGMQLYDLLASDRNRGVRDPARRIPRGRLIGRQETLDLFPQLSARGLTGAGVIHEAQMDPARLALCFLRSAAEAGAVVANYVEAARLVCRDGRVLGVQVVDKLGTEVFEIRGRVTVNAAGGWAPHLYHASFGSDLPSPLQFSRDLCLMLDRSFNDSHGLALLTRSADPDAIVSRSGRHLFLAPWRGRTLLGVWHSLMRGHPDRSEVSEAEVRVCLDEANAACPDLSLSLENVTHAQFGPVLISQSSAKRIRFATRSRIIDHAKDRIDGLFTLVGVRYTMARQAAERAVDLLLEKLGHKAVPSRTMVTPIFGGQVDDTAAFHRDARAEAPAGVAADTAGDLARRYGSEYRRVLAYAVANPDLARPLGDTTVLAAEIVHAIREEMAHTLADIVLRRTALAATGAPEPAVLQQAAACAASLLSWDAARVATEVKSVQSGFPGFTCEPTSPRR